MLDLRHAHRWLPTILFYQIIGIVQCPPMPRHHDFNSGFFRQLKDFGIPFLGIRIGISLEHQMRYVPGFEQLREKGLRRFAKDEQLGLGVELRNGGREIGLAV